MIHMDTYSSSFSIDDCLRQISDNIPDEKVINVIPHNPKRSHGYDEYDTWTTYYVDVIYKD